MKQKKNNFIIYALPVLQDNIVWIWVIGSQAVVIDPSVSEPVKNWLSKRGLCLEAILQTHHHDDHIGGTKGLLGHWPCARVIASKSDLKRIPFQTVSVSDGDEISLLGFHLKVLEVPGHTDFHIAFFLFDKQNFKIPALFSGDTLFSGGCGRLFEGTSEDMYKSLKRINSLPLETEIFCAHEYTEANLKWAISVSPKDYLIEERLKEVQRKIRNGHLSLPTSLSEERKTNLFLRANSLKEFSFLREHKDNWLK